MTEFDTPEVLAAREENAARPSTHLIQTAERRKMRERVVVEVYGTGAAKRERRVFIVLGPPASGKSKLFAEPLARQHGALLVDADLVKEHLPEYGDGRLAPAVHQESSDIAEEVALRAAIAGDNLVLPLVGRNPGRVVEIARSLRVLDYETHVVFNGLPVEIAAQRSVRRFEQTNRFVDPEYVLTIGDKPAETYARLKAEGLVDSYAHYSNDVPQSSSPLLIEASREAEPG
jgi:predicted kinase